jgi:hypothetical protein
VELGPRYGSIGNSCSLASCVDQQELTRCKRYGMRIRQLGTRDSLQLPSSRHFRPHHAFGSRVTTYQPPVVDVGKILALAFASDPSIFANGVCFAPRKRISQIDMKRRISSLSKRHFNPSDIGKVTRILTPRCRYCGPPLFLDIP